MKDLEIEAVHNQQRGNDGNQFAGMKEPYDWAVKKDWEKVILYFKEKEELLLNKMTLDEDTVFHVVASRIRQGKDVLWRLLDLLPTDQGKCDALKTPNFYGNNVLHEVAESGNREAAQLLLDIPDSGCLLEQRNDLGETPVYRAAAFGSKELLILYDKVVNYDIHFHRKERDDMSILHIAVVSQHFDTALWLNTKFEHLSKKREDKGLTSLQLLAQMPLAFKPRFIHNKNKWIKMLIYHCLPVEDEQVPPNLKGDVESNLGRNQPHQSLCSKKLSVFRMAYFSICKFLEKGWPTIHTILDEKKNQKSLEKLTHALVEKDFSWTKISSEAKDTTISMGSVEDLINCGGDCDGQDQDHKPHDKSEREKGKDQKNLTEEEKKRINVAKAKRYTPLLIATTTGAVPIVKEILKEHPQAVEHVNDNGHNILHLAIRHRQYDIFKLLRRRKSIMSRLASRIDTEGNTILHQTSDSGYYSTADQRINGPAMQLQDELLWVERVQKIMPSLYTLHHNKKNETAVELFNKKHEQLLKLAQDWMKDTSQACTVVGVLVATLVFAAAYTVPGGTDQNNGLPIFRNSPFFWFFTIMDIASLCSSLASVVMFLSILTSPLEYPYFRHSLPRKLKFGFALLFLSMITTMLAFSATIFLLTHDLQKKWTRSLVYTVALLPVTVFGLVQFPLYQAICEFIKFIYKKIIKKIF